MHIERIRFDKVFDVQARDFSFTGAGKTMYGVRLPGRIVPHEGARYAVALARPDDWSRILGWRELGTQQVFLREPAWLVVWAVTEAVFWVVAVAALAAAKLLGPWVLALLAAVACLLALHLRRRNRSLRQALLAA
jgi:hypothetical protein